MALLVHTCLYPHEDYLRALCPALNGVLWLRGYEREALIPDPILLLLQRETFPPSEIKYKSSLCRSNVMFCTSRDLNLWCLTGYSFKCSAVLQLFKNTLIPRPIFFFFLPQPWPIPRLSLTTLISLHLRPGVSAIYCISGVLRAE